MGATKLTNRQIETVRHIHGFVLSGLPPSIDDLRKALGVSSDQAVIDLVAQLEGRGLVRRTRGQARSLRLTEEGRLAVGASAGGVNALEMTANQQRVFNRLADLGENFAHMYMGGLLVLLDEGNPERIAQSAHSIRESTARLSDTGKELLTKEEASAAKKADANNARQLERIFDPLDGVRWFDQTLYDVWNKEFHQYFTRVSHHGEKPSFEEYCSQLARYEEFLSSYVLPLQTEIYARIDERLAAEPQDTAAPELKLLLSRNVESYRYFFRKVDGRWLGFLRRNDLLSPQWEVADYLARIASEAPEDVMEIIDSMRTKQEDWAVRKGFIDAAIKMPPIVASRLVEKLNRENWVQGREADWLSSSLNDLLQILIDNSMHEDALRLSRMLLAVQSPGSDPPREVRPHTSYYNYGETLRRLSSVPAAALSQYIRLLVTLLGTAISLEGPEQVNNLSMIWRPVIEDSEENCGRGDPKDLLVTSVRVAIERYLEHVKSCGVLSPSAEIDNLLTWDPPYSIFKRLRLHVYRLRADDFMPEIGKALIDEIDEWQVWHEYALLVSRVFPRVTPATRSAYLQAIDKGPAGEEEESEARRWRALRVSVIRDHLSPTELEKYRSLIPEAEEMPHPHLGAMWVGPTSPSTEDDLRTMPVGALVEHLATWKPVRDWLSPSREGLGRTLSAVVGKSAELFSKEAPRFLDPRIRPVYLYHLLLGLHEGHKNKAHLDWEGVLSVADCVIDRARSGALPVLESDSWDDKLEPRWDGVCQEIASLLEAGLNDREEGLPFTSRNEIWRVLEFLCEHPDPTPEYEAQYGGNNMDSVTLSINTVRGRAFHALFAYVFWCDRHLKNSDGHGSRIAEETKRVLEAHLDVTRDASLTVRSVYGRYFPWLFGFDRDWASGLIERLFPAGEPELRYAAWETYLANGVFREVYTALRPQYKQAVSELRSFKKERRYWADPVRRLAEHMMIAYAYRTGGDQDALWVNFFRVADPNQRGAAVSFCGRSYINRKETRSGEKFPETNRLQEFWEWRLAASKDVEELKEFGWLVRGGSFNNRWMLERLIETLERTGGVIEANFLVLPALSALAGQHPGLCARALSLMVKSRSADRLMLGHSKDLEQILSVLYSGADAEALSLAEGVIDHLTKLGFEHYRSIPQVQQQLPPEPPTA